jgi:hypothetical protein
MQTEELGIICLLDFLNQNGSIQSAVSKTEDPLENLMNNES